MPTLAAIDATPQEIEQICAAAGKPILSYRALQPEDEARCYARLTLPDPKGDAPKEKKPREPAKCRRVEVTHEVYALLVQARERLVAVRGGCSLRRRSTSTGQGVALGRRCIQRPSPTTL